MDPSHPVSGGGKYVRAFRRHPVTWSLAAICVAVYVGEVAFSGNGGLLAGRGPVGPVIAFAAVIAPLVVQGERWRLVTAGFVHFDLTHIVFNMVGLVYAGRWCEERFGGARTLAIFLAAVVLGDVAALVTTIDSQTITAGASGGIMGLFAAMAVIGYRFPVERESLSRAAGPILATLLNGFVHPGVSNAGHLGGLIGGGMSAVALGPAPGWVERSAAAHAAALEAALRIERETPIPVLPAGILEDPNNTLRFERPLRETAQLWALGGVAGLTAGAGVAGQRWELAALGLAVVALAAFGILNHATLVLTPLGFEVRQRLRRGRPVAWRDVQSLGIASSPRGAAGQQWVNIALTPTAVQRRAAERGRVGAAASWNMSARFGMSALEQGQLMEAWRQRWSAPDAGGVPRSGLTQE